MITSSRSSTYGNFRNIQRLFDEGRLKDAFWAIQSSAEHVPDTLWGCLFQQCINSKNLQMGREASTFMAQNGIQYTAYVGSYLIRMFDACGSLSEADEVFKSLGKHNCYTWSAIISAHVNHGKANESIKLYFQMHKSGRKPDGHTFVAVLQACIVIKSLSLGMEIHSHVIENLSDIDVVIGNALIDMYSKCGSVLDGRDIFNKITLCDTVTWNSMIGGYCQSGFWMESTDLLRKMQHHSMLCDTFTFVSILTACSNLQLYHEAKHVHVSILGSCFMSDVHIGSALIGMYCKLGNLMCAQHVFNGLLKKNLVVWNAMITGYVENACWNEALELFEKMENDGHESPDCVTFISVLKASSSSRNRDYGKTVHALIVKSGFEQELLVGNTLIDMYAKSRDIEEAEHVFYNLPARDLVTWNAIISAHCQHSYGQIAAQLFIQMRLAGLKPDIVTWNALIAGYAQHGHGEEALELFCLMHREEGTLPDNFTFASILKACSSISALDQGKLLHSYVIENNEFDSFVECAIVDMYVKCGSHEDALKTFQGLSKTDIVIWNAMLTGCALNNEYNLALNYFKEMQQKGLQPDDVTYVNLLSICNHLGLVEAACNHLMDIHGNAILPKSGHYNCIADILGRSGRLKEAVDLLQTIPLPDNVLRWTSLLNNCRTYGNVPIGRRCFNEVVSIDENYGSAYVMLSNIYADRLVEWENLHYKSSETADLDDSSYQQTGYLLD